MAEVLENTKPAASEAEASRALLRRPKIRSRRVVGLTGSKSTGPVASQCQSPARSPPWARARPLKLTPALPGNAEKPAGSWLLEEPMALKPGSPLDPKASNSPSYTRCVALMRRPSPKS